jgi:hypothetical protein
MTATARVLEPEWLDVLPASDPRAQRSRRDLVRVNTLMGHPRMLRSLLRDLAPLGSIAEIGAGDGRFLAAALEGAGLDGEVTLVDRSPVAHAFAGARVVRADVFDWLPTAPRFDAIVANLFLHHFEDGDLARLLALVAGRTRIFVALEPRRAAFALYGAHLLGFVGCNDVTRHDAVVSVRAGFTGHELSRLWPSEGWTRDEGPRGLFTHAFVARR